MFGRQLPCLVTELNELLDDDRSSGLANELSSLELRYVETDLKKSCWMIINLVSPLLAELGSVSRSILCGLGV